jgi:phage shock protein PspC (stress-responsive transcriptional regulator)
MHSSQPNLFTRPDTFFGVCEGFGEDMRIHPNILRLAMAGLMFVSPYAAIASYVALGAIVGLSRLLFPTPNQQIAVTVVPSTEPVESFEPQTADVRRSEDRVLLAA